MKYKENSIILISMRENLIVDPGFYEYYIHIIYICIYILYVYVYIYIYIILIGASTLSW